MTTHTKKLSELRIAMKEAGLEAYLVPSNDEFMNEYVPEYARRLEWLTGFSGSAGMAVILKDKAAFFTDGRYTLQAAQQLPEGQYEIINSGDIKPTSWLQNNLPKGGAIGINPMLFSKDGIAKYNSAAKLQLCNDLIDKIWKNKPKKPVSDINIHPIEYTGKNSADKITHILAVMRNQGADMLLLTAPDSICWLLNIRGRDVPNTPLVLSRLLLNVDGTGTLFADCKDKSLVKKLGGQITIQPLKSLHLYLKEISGKKIILDKNSAPYLFFNELEKNNTIIEINDPCTLPKACKNNIEVQGTIDAHLRDGLAVTSFLFWLDTNYKHKRITEISAAESLLKLRKKDKLFIESSFDTIAGFASNGAIVHYKAAKATNKHINGNGLFLLDSGGQYLNGTTDITRTIAIGTPNPEQKRNFTLVLKGHIAIATAIFPEGTSGNQLDILARQYLWQNGLDYDHGTGHGVGSFLGVHEGPQRISKAYSDVALMPGMILSNEPGYYKNGEYGIRIENLVVVEDANITKKGKKFFKFKTVTCAPIDNRLVDLSLLNKEEKEWLKKYNISVYDRLSKLLDKKIVMWLSEML